MHRAVTVAACTLVGITAGTLYLFSAWGPQLAHRLRYSGTQLAFVAFAGSLGVALSGVPGGFLVDRSLAQATGLGGLLIGSGYAGLALQFNAQLSSVVVSAALACLVGVGSTLVNSSMIKCAALCFPHHRGLATSFPIATYGLSAFAYSIVGHWIFGADTERFLGFMGLSTAVICAMGLPVVYYAERGPVLEQPIEMRPHDSHEQPTSQDLDKSAVLRSSRFWILLTLLGLLAGLGQLYIYSCGSMVKSLLNTEDEHVVAHAQSFQVSLLSICNCAGRLLCGATGDFLSNHLHQQRSWVVLVPALVLLIVQISSYSTSSYSHMWLASALNGAGYGFAWSSIPQILIEFFGVEPFSFSWGFIQIGTILPTFFFTHLFGAIYDSNTQTDESTGANVCTKGNGCYNRTFLISSGFALSSVLLAVWINLRPYMQRKYHSLA